MGFYVHSFDYAGAKRLFWPKVSLAAFYDTEKKSYFLEDLLAKGIWYHQFVPGDVSENATQTRKRLVALEPYSIIVARKKDSEKGYAQACAIGVVLGKSRDGWSVPVAWSLPHIPQDKCVFPMRGWKDSFTTLSSATPYVDLPDDPAYQALYDHIHKAQAKFLCSQISNVKNVMF